MYSLASQVEHNPAVAQVAFETVEGALNLVLPGSGTHERYEGAGEVGLAVLIGETTHASYNPFDNDRPDPTFSTNNQAERSEAWEAMPIPPEFLYERSTDLGRFSFFALAKAENLRITGNLSSYNPNQLGITPGRVGFAGARRLMGSFVSVSGLWEVHDHLVSGAYAIEVNGVATGLHDAQSVDAFAEFFERKFAGIQKLHEGVAAADLSHADVRKFV